MIGAFFTILALVAVFVSLAAHGVMSPEKATECLIGLVILLAIGWAIGSGLIGSIVRIGLPIVLVLVLAQYYSGGNRDVAAEIVYKVCEIGLMLFGIFIMVAGPFRR